MENNDTKLLEVVAKSYKENSTKIDTLKMYAENKHGDVCLKIHR